MFFLSQASLYLALALKSNSTKSIFKAIEKIKSINISTVPSHLKNNSNNYKNPHNYQGLRLEQEYLPNGLKGFKFWEPSHHGWEKSKFEELRKIKES